MNLAKHWVATLDDYVIDLAWSPDGRSLAAASASGPVSLFSAGNGAGQCELPGHEGGTNAMAFAPDSILATGGQDGTVKLWDAATGQDVATTKLGNAWVEHLAWAAATGGLFASAGRTLAALSRTGEIVHQFKPAPKTITALAAMPAPSVLIADPGIPAPASRAAQSIAVSFFGGVCLWDADEFTVRKEFPYANGIEALVWSPDGKWLVSGNQDPSVHLWIPAEDAELQMSGYEGKVRHLSFDHSSRWLATGGGRDACVWDCSGAGPEGREPAMLPHNEPVCAVAFQNAHGLLATASQDGVVMLWSPERKQPLRATVKMPVAPTKLAWSPDDSLLAIGSEKGAVYVLKSD